MQVSATHDKHERLDLTENGDVHNVVVIVIVVRGNSRTFADTGFEDTAATFIWPETRYTATALYGRLDIRDEEQSLRRRCHE
jgi:hypothetical protein